MGGQRGGAESLR